MVASREDTIEACGSRGSAWMRDVTRKCAKEAGKACTVLYYILFMTARLACWAIVFDLLKPVLVASGPSLTYDIRHTT